MEIKEGGLDPGECTVDFSDDTTRIAHRPSESRFLLADSPVGYTTTAIVGDNPSFPIGPLGWVAATERIGRWAKDVKEDVDMPDLWDELQREREALTIGLYEAAENTPLTQAEQAEIAEQLRQIKNYAKMTYTLSEAQMASLDEKLAMIQSAAARIGRKDWQILVIGVLSTLIIERLLPPEVVQHVFTTVLQSLTHFFLPLLQQPRF